MKTAIRVFSLIAFGLVVFVWLGNFANGFLCTRVISFLVAPIEIVLIPAFLCLVVAIALLAISVVRDRLAKRPRQFVALRYQGMTLFLLVLQFVGFDPRLAGLVTRAKWSEKDLLAMAKAYRVGGQVAVHQSKVDKWEIGWKARYYATPDFVEVSWGSTLPASWGFRVCDRVEPEPTPQYRTDTDDEALPATERITAFIGLW